MKIFCPVCGQRLVIGALPVNAEGNTFAMCPMCRTKMRLGVKRRANGVLDIRVYKREGAAE